MPLSSALLNRIGNTEEALKTQLFHDIKEILSSMAGIEEVVLLALDMELQLDSSNLISSMVGMTGSFKGILYLHLPEFLSFRLASRMLCEDFSQINGEVIDAIGEIANMIAGSFKLNLPQKGADVRLSTPSIVYKGAQVPSIDCGMENFSLLLATEGSRFAVFVSLDVDHGVDGGA